MSLPLEVLEEFATANGYEIESLIDRWVDTQNFIDDTFRVRQLDGTLVPYTRYPYTDKFINDGFEYVNTDRIVLKSRQIGFSTAMELEAIVTCLTYPAVEVSVVSHKYDAAKKIVAACARMIKDAALQLPVDENAIQKELITFQNDSRIVPYSNNPDSVRSENIIKAFLDEFAFFPKQQELLDAIVPKVSRGGSIAICSTPLANNDVFMTKFRKAYDDERPESEKSTLAYYHPLFEPGTVDENISLFEQKDHLEPLCQHILWDRVESVREESIARFMQEYMCIPIDDSLAYYPHPLIMDTVNDVETTTMHMEALSQYRRGTVYIGIDFALVRDQTAIVVVYEKDYKHYVIDFQVTRDDIETQLAMIDNCVRNYRPQMIRCDKTSAFGIQMTRYLLKKEYGYLVEGITYTPNVKQEMALRLKMYMQNTPRGMSPCVYIPNDKELISQIYGIRVNVTEGGTIQLSGKEEYGRDDIVNALWLSLPPVKHEYQRQPESHVPKRNDYHELEYKQPTGRVHARHVDSEAMYMVASTNATVTRRDRSNLYRSRRR